MKNSALKSILLGLAFIALSAMVVMGTAPQKPVSKPTDTYGDHQQYCYNKCTHYKTIQGKCVDYEWIGTKKECCDWKTVGKGKCLEYKKTHKCDKYSKNEKICLGHGYKQFCTKVTKHKICAKYEWKELCKHHGKNNACDEYAYHFICTKYGHSARCAEETYVPKIKYFHKKRCAKYSVHQYCAKYKKLSRTVAKWVPVSKKHYKGWIDHYYKQVLEKKYHTICVAYAKRKTCTKYENVKFAKKIGYEKKCVKIVRRKYCVAKQKAKFCTKWTPSKFCDLKEKVRICKAFREDKFCCDYTAKPYCTQYKTLKPRCIKRSFKKHCVKKSPGYKVCVKYNFVGGKRICKKHADKSVCAKKKRVCTKVDTYKPPKKVDTYKPPKKVDTYKPPKKVDTYKK